MINNQLIKAKDSLKIEFIQSNAEMREYYTYMIELYNTCLDCKIEIEYISGFIIQNGKLSILTYRCSAHFNQNVDEIGNFEYTLYLKDWRKYLTPYIMSILK